MNGGWQPAVERLAVSAAVQGSQVIGFISPEPRSGVTTLARMVAQTLCLSATPALLVCLGGAPHARISGEPSSQRRPEQSRAVLQARLWHRLMPDDGGLTTLVATPTAETRYLFNNATWLRKTLSDELSTHAKLILDLPSLHPDDVRTINPLGPATFCDSLILVCVRGRTTRQHLTRTVEQLRLAQVNLAGIIFNDYGYTSPGEDMARTARRYWWAMPGLSRRLARTALNSELLR